MIVDKIKPYSTMKKEVTTNRQYNNETEKAG